MESQNQKALAVVDELVARASSVRAAVVRDESGARFIDCGVHVPGGLEAGLLLARVCMSDLAMISLVPDAWGLPTATSVQVVTDDPIRACMAAQYAGWQVSGDNYFGMGSGPMRLLRGKEPLLEKLELRETSQVAVGVIESNAIASSSVAEHIAGQCHVDLEHLNLCFAPTASLAGTIQVVSRSVETALHKLFELGFDLRQVRSARGVAPLPPVAANDLRGIGWTNDAILYGGQVTLWVEADDQQLQELGPQVPSCGSRDFGQPFYRIFEKYDRDFYKIDPLLFSPAQITFVNLATGHHFQFGQTNLAVLQESFGS